jgi:hypothetical protein
MQHLDDGALRRSIDDPLWLAAPARAHLASCASCTGRRSEIARPAQFAAQRLGFDAGGRLDVESSLAKMKERLNASTDPTLDGSPLARVDDYLRWQGRTFFVPAAAAIAVIAAGLALALTPAGTLAQNFLTIFEPHQFVAVPVTKAEIQYLPDLQSFGSIVEHLQPADRDVASPGQAEAMTGLPVRLPSWVPNSLPRPAHYVAVSRGSATFIFSAAKAAAFAARMHRAMPAMPPGLDGSSLTLRVGPMVIIGYGRMPSASEDDARRPSGEDEGASMDLPPLVIAEAAAPDVTSTGASAREIETYLLDMPGVAPQLADEIRAIGDPSTTMPIPVPIDEASSQNVAIDGVVGLGIGDETGLGSIVVWQKKGIVYGVGGAMGQQELMEVARSIR